MSDDGSVSLPPGTTLGRYQLLRRLGVGGMGEVFEAKHLDLDKTVAVKTLHGAVAARADVRTRFLREGQAAARLRHPNAVDVTDVGMVDGVPFLVMEMLRGEDLQSLLRRQRVLGPDLVAATLLPVLSALSAAHAEGIVHRDLKPANIFLHRSRDGALVPKVLDFGISKMAVEDGTALTGTSALMGTPSYISPEQLVSTRDVDPRADIYSLGVILYECLTGALPFRGDTPFVIMSAVSTGVFAPPRAVRPEIPEALEQVVVRAMSRDPAQRFGSAQELAQALLPFADAPTAALWSGRVSLPPAPSPSAAPLGPMTDAPPSPSISPTTLSGKARNAPQPPRGRRRNAWLGGVAAVSVLAIAAVSLAIAQRPGSATTASEPRAATARSVLPAAPASIVRAPTVAQRAVAPPPPAPAPPAAPVAATPAAPPRAPAQRSSVATAPPLAARSPAGGPPEADRRTRRRREQIEPSHILTMPVAVPPSPAVGTNAMPVVR